MRSWRLFATVGMLSLPLSATAQSLPTIFESAWLRQPEQRALAAQQAAAEARQESAASLTPEPPSVAVAARSDRFNRDSGAQELELELAIPLWLPGERGAAQALADAEYAAVDLRQRAARLRLAGEVRDLYWRWQTALGERELAATRRDNAAALVADVERRLRAGDLARTDFYQARAAAAAAESAWRESQVRARDLQGRLAALSGVALGDTGPTEAPRAEPEPADEGMLANHVLLAEAVQRVDLARRARTLVAAQGRANPELSVATRRERGAFEAPYEQSWQLAVRWPFGSAGRNAARLAAADAEQIAAESQLALERARLAEEAVVAREGVTTARARLTASEERERLLAETRGFLDKSFRLGQTDLASRLRVEFEAAEAAREAARSRIELAQAISQLRQALGLFPESQP